MGESHLYLSTGAPLAAVPELLVKIPPESARQRHVTSHLQLPWENTLSPIKPRSDHWSSRLGREKYHHKNSSLEERLSCL